MTTKINQAIANGTRVTTRDRNHGVVIGYGAGWYKIRVGDPATLDAGTGWVKACRESWLSVAADKAEAAVAADSTKKAPGKSRTPRQVALPGVGHSCACGCGVATKKASRYFIQGHDARFHGWMRRIANGELTAAEIPASARKLMAIVDGTPTTDYDGSSWKV